MRRLGALFIIAAALAWAATPAGAQVQQVDIPVDTVVRGVAEGDIVGLITVPVDPDLIGATCTGDATGRNNQGSVHPGNDLIVTTGDTSELVPDVERAPGAVTEITGQLVLGTDITVSLQMGPDGTFSGGIDLTLDCMPPPPETTTTTTAPPTTTTVPPTTTTGPTTTEPPATTTTAPPQASTTAPPATVPSEDTTTTAPPQASTAAPPDSTAGQLPATGPRDGTDRLAAIGAVLLAAGVAALTWERRQRQRS